MSDQTTDIIDGETGEISNELVHVGQRPQIIRAMDMRNAATDSWTDVLEDVADLAVKIAGTDFVPSDYRGKPGQVAATMLHGRELGLAPMTALALTNPIKGKPTLSAEGMRSLVQQAGHQIKVAELSSSRCVMRGRRAGDDEWTTVEWTLEDARQAGLLRKSRSGEPTNWDKYPRAMLLARATTELCRIEFADVIHGMRSSEELLDEIDSVTPYEPPPAAQQTTTVQRRTPAKKTAPKAQEQPQQAPEQPAAADEAPAQTPARKRAPLPGKKTSPGVGEATRPEAGPSVEDQQAEVRRLSEERRNLKAAADRRPAETSDAGGEADEPEVSTGRDTGPTITPQQRTVLIMHFERLDVRDRDERLLWTCQILGLEPGSIPSASNLTQAEAIKIIQVLERLKNRDQLDQLLNGQSELIP